MEKRSSEWKKALGTDNCPSLEDLMSALSDESLSREFQEHLATCPRCEAEVALYREFEHAEVMPGKEEDLDWIVGRLQEATPDMAAERSRREASSGLLQQLFNWLAGAGWRPLAPVGAALLAAALLLLVWPTGPGQVGQIHDPGTVRSTEIRLTGPLGALSEAPKELSWQVPPGAATFLVSVYEVDRTKLWEGESQVGSIQIPEAIRNQMSVGRRFLWQVVALDGKGNQMRTSEMADFEIRIPANDRESREQ